MEKYEIVRLSPENIRKLRILLGISRDRFANLLDLFSNEAASLEKDESSKAYRRFKHKAKNKLNSLLKENEINIRII